MIFQTHQEGNKFSFNVVNKHAYYRAFDKPKSIADILSCASFSSTGHFGKLLVITDPSMIVPRRARFRIFCTVYICTHCLCKTAYIIKSCLFLPKSKIWSTCHKNCFTLKNSILPDYFTLIFSPRSIYTPTDYTSCSLYKISRDNVIWVWKNQIFVISWFSDPFYNVNFQISYLHGHTVRKWNEAKCIHLYAMVPEICVLGPKIA